jgi:hypothetical protein
MSKIEEKIKAEKKQRVNEIWEHVAIVVCIIFILWIVASWGEVMYHNDLWYSKGEVHEYSVLNFFQLIVKLANFIKEVF